MANQMAPGMKNYAGAYRACNGELSSQGFGDTERASIIVQTGGEPKGNSTRKRRGNCHHLEVAIAIA